MTGIAPSGPSGVRDYGRLLAEELRRRGVDASDLWVDNEGVELWPATVAGVTFLRRVRRLPAGVVVWHYSPFAYAYRGLPLAGVFAGVLLRTRRVPVVTVLHELAYPWRRRGLRGATFAATQRVALLAVLIGSTAAVVTTEQRAEWLRGSRWLPVPASLTVVPVFSTIPPVAPARPAGDGVLRLGVLGWGSDGAQPELLFAALRYIEAGPLLRIVLLGAPGQHSKEARRWLQVAGAAGAEHLLEFTGVVPLPELSGHLRNCHVVTLLDEEGPTSRRTTLVAALAHGCAIVATDGPNRWEDAVRHRTMAVVPPDAEVLGRALRRLLDDPEARAVMGARAEEYYQRECSVESVADAIVDVIAGVTMTGEDPAASTPRRTSPRRRQ